MMISYRMQGAPRWRDKHGSLGDIPARGREYPDKIGPFGPLLHLFQRSQLVAGFTRRLSAQQEKVRRNQVVGSQNDGTLDDVGQLPDIAWPVVQHEELHCLRGEALGRLVHLVTEALQEVVGQEGDVLAALAQWGEENRDDMDAVVEILTKPPRLDSTPQILIRGSNKTEVDSGWSLSSYGVEFTLLQYP